MNDCVKKKEDVKMNKNERGNVITAFFIYVSVVISLILFLYTQVILNVICRVLPQFFCNLIICYISPKYWRVITLHALLEVFVLFLNAK